MSNLNQNTLVEAIGKGISVGIIEEAIHDGGRQSVMDGVYMGGASLVGAVLGDKNPLANPQMWGPNAQVFSDGVFFAAIEAIARKSERSPQEIFRNLLVAMGSSLLTSTVLAPIQSLNNASDRRAVRSTVASPSVPSTIPVQRSVTTSSY